MMNYTAYRSRVEGYLTIRGVNFGYSNGSDLKIVYEKDPYFIVRVKGGSDWSGRGETTYYPSSYYLWKIVNKYKDKYGELIYALETIKEIEAGKKWKDAINQLIKLIEDKKNGTK